MEEMMERCKNYLIKTQKEDGSWGSGDPFACARILYALKETEAPEEILEKGIAYIESCQDKSGRFAGKTIMYTDAANTAYSLFVLNKFDYSKASSIVNRSLIWLLENQNEDGSWSGRNRTKNAYTTSVCLRALFTFYLTVLGKYTKALSYTLNYLDETDFKAEHVSHVYAPVLNLKRIESLPDDLQIKFIEYAGEALPKAMDSGEIADVAYLLGTLKALGEERYTSQCMEWLKSKQSRGDGFARSVKESCEPNWTALVVLAVINKL